MRPSDREVDQVMHETGMDRMQAYRHVQSRNILRAKELNKRRRLRDTPHD